MSYGKFKFKDKREFQHLQDLAISKGIETMSEFNKFIEEYFNTKK